MTAADALKDNPLFEDLDDEMIEKLAGHLEQVKFKAGDIIAGEGEPAGALYVLAKGKVKVSKGGGKAEVVELTPPAHFGEMGILLEAPRTATVTAMENSELYVLSVEAADEALVSSPDAAGLFFRALAISLAERLKATTDDIGMLKGR